MAAKWNEKINKNKHYNAYLVHWNYYQIWENNRMPMNKQKERDLQAIKCRERKKNKRN